MEHILLHVIQNERAFPGGGRGEEACLVGVRERKVPGGEDLLLPPPPCYCDGGLCTMVGLCMLAQGVGGIKMSGLIRPSTDAAPTTTTQSEEEEEEGKAEGEVKSGSEEGGKDMKKQGKKKVGGKKKSTT